MMTVDELSALPKSRQVIMHLLIHLEIDTSIYSLFELLFEWEFLVVEVRLVVAYLAVKLRFILMSFHTNGPRFTSLVMRLNYYLVRIK